jgi:hypothetical protein
MKDIYEAPELDMILLKSADIICTSIPDPDDNETPLA